MRMNILLNYTYISFHLLFHDTLPQAIGEFNIQPLGSGCGQVTALLAYTPTIQVRIPLKS